MITNKLLHRILLFSTVLYGLIILFILFGFNTLSWCKENKEFLTLIIAGAGIFLNLNSSNETKKFRDATNSPEIIFEYASFTLIKHPAYQQIDTTFSKFFLVKSRIKMEELNMQFFTYLELKNIGLGIAKNIEFLVHFETKSIINYINEKYPEKITIEQNLNSIFIQFKTDNFDEDIMENPSFIIPISENQKFKYLTVEGGSKPTQTAMFPVHIQNLYIIVAILKNNIFYSKDKTIQKFNESFEDIPNPKIELRYLNKFNTQENKVYDVKITCDSIFEVPSSDLLEEKDLFHFMVDIN